MPKYEAKTWFEYVSFAEVEAPNKKEALKKLRANWFQHEIDWHVEAQRGDIDIERIERR